MISYLDTLSVHRANCTNVPKQPFWKIKAETKDNSYHTNPFKTKPSSFKYYKQATATSTHLHSLVPSITKQRVLRAKAVGASETPLETHGPISMLPDKTQPTHKTGVTVPKTLNEHEIAQTHKVIVMPHKPNHVNSFMSPAQALTKQTVNSPYNGPTKHHRFEIL